MIHEVKQFIKKIYYPISSIPIYCKEFGHTFLLNKIAKQKKLESMILVTVHSLEKGMGIKNTRKGYGQTKARKALSYMEEYLRKGYGDNSFAFLEGIKMLEIYIDYNNTVGIELPDISERLAHLKNEKVNQEASLLKCGFSYLAKDELISGDKMDFDSFISCRHSIRDFEDRVVDKELVLSAINMANKAPSACNRQPVKVYCTQTNDQAKLVDELITGTTGFKDDVHNFMIVTADRAAFAGKEQFQWYVNGGIYLSYLTLALHSLGLGTCIMQWFPFYNTEKKLKQLIGASKSEAIIATVGFGYYKDNNKCICSQRRNVEDTLTFIQSN